MLARIFLHMAQPVDAVALDEPHGAGKIIWPHRLGTIARFDRIEPFSNAIQCLVPGNPPELTAAFWSGPQQRMDQALGVVDTFRIACDLGADHACGIGIVLRAAYRADMPPVDHLYLQRAGGGPIVRTD